MTIPLERPITQDPPSRKKTFRRIGADRYRAIELRIWDLIRGLDGDASRLFLYLWAGPHSTPYGILRLPDGYVLVDLGWTPAQLTRAWEALKAADVVWRDNELAFIVPFLMSNPPANGDVIKHWCKAVMPLPASPLFKQLYLRACAWVTEDGLTWLTSKIDTVSHTVSTRSGDGVDTEGDTVRTLSTSTQYQEPESRKQTQEAGVRVQGSGGEGEGEEPDGALRSASPLEASSLRAPMPGSHPTGGPKAAWERNNGKPATKAAQRMREDVRKLFEQEATMADGLKPLEYWLRWFPKQYDPAMLTEVFHEVRKA